ncbi:hypothetical protein [Flavihumibacter petaseus]|uniref:Lipoprotein n=1 Tax=Flavihumibacter petaseus NBRC 106054 TaxID=1220578 RepID=A0A0E9N5Q9_9BACT|nr:hypothetical protein [Flavihumibacter petaseus]GAO45154.1 hypothetical protein FPE01S_04_03970 [Flavihumibacter petaseus NBRC 106054]
MRQWSLYLLLFAAVSGGWGCAATTTRKSADYYRENREDIEEMIRLYDQSYRHQPFSAGFTDKSYRYYVMEVVTDTVRYIYDTEYDEWRLYGTIMRYNYDTASLRKISQLMEKTKCLWISKTSFFVEEKRETVTYLSFRSAKTVHPFVENKYYILVFLNQPVTHPAVKERISRGDLVRISDLVYFTIGSRYR